MKRIIIAGCGFTGYSAALHLKRLLGNEHEILVISKSPFYVYSPGLSGIPFGLRQTDEISFDVRPVLAGHDIGFRSERIIKVDARNNAVETSSGSHGYDYLLIALGPSAERMRPWGLGSARTSWSIITLEDALRTRDAWKRFVLAPGPMVVGAIEGSPLYAAHYQFALNAVQDLASRGIRERVEIRFLTPEPKLGQFGAGGAVDSSHLAERVFAHRGIEWTTGARIQEVRDHRVILESGEEIRTSFTMLMPRFIGADAVRASHGVGNASGLIEVNESCRHPEFGNLFAAGLATTFRWNNSTIVSGGLPMTIYPAERMAQMAAANIAAAIHGEPFTTLSFHDLAERCAHDAHQMIAGVVEGAFPQQRSRELLQAGSQAHELRRRFEHEFLQARERGVIG